MVIVKHGLAEKSKTKEKRLLGEGKDNGIERGNNAPIKARFIPQSRQ